MIAFATRTSPTAHARTTRTASWLVQVFLAGLFGLAGIGRLGGRYQDLIDQANRLTADLWLRWADGTLEPGSAIGLAVPAVLALVTFGLVAFVVVASLTHLVGLLVWAHGPLARRG